MIPHLRAIAITLVFPVLLCGCWNAREIENLLYVNALGIDHVDNEFVVYAQILSFSNIAKEEAGGERTSKGVAVAKGSGRTFVNALFNIYPTSQKQMTWSHIRSIVFSERALEKKHMEEILDELDRFYEFRYTLWTYATKDPILDIFNAKQVFNLPVIYSQLANPSDLYEQNSVLRPMKLFQFIARRDEPNLVVYVPILSINRNSWSEDKKALPKLKMIGACLLQNLEPQGCWPRSDLLGLRWLDEHTVRTLLGITKGGQLLAMTILEKPKVKIEPRLQNGMVTFTIDIHATGYITQVMTVGPIIEIEKEAAKKIEAEVRSLFEKGRKHNIDTLQLGHALYRKYPQEWKRLQKNNTLPLSQESLSTVNVQVKLNNGGISKVKQAN